MKTIKINEWNLELPNHLFELINDNSENIIPEKDKVFNIFKLIKAQDVKVVFLGQDPYPKKGDANGIAFSVDRNYNLPASLRNLYKELDSDLNIKRTDGDLSNLVSQGVFFLNTILTVEVGKPKSHKSLGWEEITSKIVKDISIKNKIIFVLLGKQAQKYINIIDSKSIIICAPHPSPLSAYRGFFGSKIFSKINQILLENNQKIIDWSK